MSADGRHGAAGPSRHVAPSEVARRQQIDGLARERSRELPAWVTTQVDLALAAGLLRDDDLPAKAGDVCDLVRENGWALTELHRLVGAGYLDAREARLMSWPGKRFVAKLALDAGPDLRGRIEELRAVTAP